MWRCWILIVCATGTTALLVEPNNNSLTRRKNEQNQYVRRFACPIGFFRLKGFCYYLSAGTAPWRDAYFHCKDRNATLAVLDKPGKNRMLRKYLAGIQFTKLERWIGGIYNWQQMHWEWGVTGEPIEYENFDKSMTEKSGKPEYAWHCLILDPMSDYKWTARSCVARKYYVCQVPAGRIKRRGRKTPNPLAPQNQRLKPRKKGKTYTGEAEKKNTRKNKHGGRRRNWKEQIPNKTWVHGVNLGSRPPRGQRYRMKGNTTRTVPDYPMVAQILPQKRRFAFQGSHNRGEVQQLASTNDNQVVSLFHSKINNLASEEVLLKP